MKQYHLNQNRKKIRGWKRRIRHLDVWGAYIKEPYLKSFKNVGDYTYERSIIDPFYRLIKRHPPLWFYKLIIKKLIVAHDNWEKVFTNLGIPYDLVIWLYDPSYIRSQVICYAVEQQGDKITYAWESKENKTFPYRKFTNIDIDFKNFEWILADEELVHFESELEDENFTANDLLADGYLKKDSGENGIYYAKKVGDIWVGRHRK